MVDPAMARRVDQAVLVATADGKGRAEVTRASFLSVPDAVSMLRDMAASMEAEQAAAEETPS